jgi:hypothetical protein
MGMNDPLVGGWESEAVTQGHRDTFDIRPDLTGSGTYYSALPGTACAATITAHHGLKPANYIGVVELGPPCSAVLPMLGFNCDLVDDARRLTCSDALSYRRR